MYLVEVGNCKGFTWQYSQNHLIYLKIFVFFNYRNDFKQLAKCYDLPLIKIETELSGAFAVKIRQRTGFPLKYHSTEVTTKWHKKFSL